MKKLTTLLLTLVLLISLAVPALAANVVLSPQNLQVNGAAVNCEKYNIDGSNYFKLRDLAYVLDGTSSQFDVGWDAANKVVSIMTSHAYTTPNGHELEIGADLSATAQLSAQAIMIDGEVRADLTAYNIGGSNFFKLRELGDALGFDVDYDGQTNTAIVNSAAPAVETPDAAPEKVWAVASNQSSPGSAAIPYTYDEYGNVTQDMTYTYSYEYDAAGRVTLVGKNGISSDWTEQDQYEYNDQGLVAKKRHTYSFGGTEDTVYEYDAAGRVVREAQYSGRTLLREYLSVYDAAGLLITYDAKSYGNDAKTSYTDHDAYTYTADGKPLTMTETNAAGETVKNAVWTYDAAGRVTNMALTSYGETRTYDYTYTAEGRVSSCTDAKGTVYTFTWRADGTLETAHLEPGEGVYFPDKADYYFNEAGQLTRVDTYSRGTTTISETDTMTYDENGNLISYLNERLSRGTMKRNYGSDYTYVQLEPKAQPAGSAIRHNYAGALPGYSRDLVLEAILSFDLFSQNI